MHANPRRASSSIHDSAAVYDVVVRTNEAPVSTGPSARPGRLGASPTWRSLGRLAAAAGPARPGRIPSRCRTQRQKPRGDPICPHSRKQHGWKEPKNGRAPCGEPSASGIGREKTRTTKKKKKLASLTHARLYWSIKYFLSRLDNFMLSSHSQHILEL